MFTVQLLVVLPDLLCSLIMTILNTMLYGIYNEIFVTYINVTYALSCGKRVICVLLFAIHTGHITEQFLRKKCEKRETNQFYR